MTVHPETYAMFKRSIDMDQSEDIGSYLFDLEWSINRLAEFLKTPGGREQAREPDAANSIEEAGMHLNGIIAFVLRKAKT